MPVATVTAEQFEFLREDPRRFISGLKIVDPQGGYAWFNTPHWEQRQILDALLSDARQVVILKPRQVGASTVTLAWIFAQLYWSTRPESCLLTSHFASSADTLWQRMRGMAQTLPDALRRNFTVENRKTLQFKTGARIKMLSAASPAGARSDTFTTLINDEVGYWGDAAGGDDRARKLWADLMSTAHEGARIVTLSTPNGPGTLFHERVIHAQRLVADGRTDVRFLFFPWKAHAAYAKEPPPTWEPNADEEALASLHGLTLPQLYWRHEKIHGVDGIGLDRFRMEYPLTIEDGFLLADGAWFDLGYLSTLIAELQGREQKHGKLRLYERPVAGAAYAIGVDPSLCTGGDYAVAQVLDDAGKQVAVLSTNAGSVEQFADEVAELAEHYNHARTLVESNAGGGGNIVLKRLQSYGVNLWQAPLEPGERASPGKSRHWTTSHANKEAAYSHLRQMVNGDVLDLHDLPTVQELSHIRHEDGTIEGRDGMKDDHAMALCLAAWNLRTLPKPAREPRYTPRKRTVSDPWSRSRV